MTADLSALIARLVGYATHDDACTTNRYPGHEACSCGLSSALQEARHILRAKQGERE